MTDVLLTAQFTRDLNKLAEIDRRRVKEAAFKIQSDPDSTGLNPEKIKATKDYWSYRATQDIRIVARRAASICSLVAVDRHRQAYARAMADNFGALPDPQVLESLRATGGSPLPFDDESPRLSGPLFNISDETLRSEFGVPEDWILAIRSVPDRDGLWSIGIDEVINENQFYRLEEFYPAPSLVSTGAEPVYRLPTSALARAFAQGDVLDLEFNLPASSWSIINSAKRSPILVKGGPGSGKTLVALYRALHVLEGGLDLGILANPRILYVTYTNQLCDDARNKIGRLRGSVPDGLTISTYDSIAERLAGPNRRTIYPPHLDPYIAKALQGQTIDSTFFQREIADCIQWKNLRTLEEYEGTDRRGRRNPLSATSRRALWSAYEAYGADLALANCRDLGTMRMLAADASGRLPDTDKYDLVIVDEVQDLPLPVLIMLANLAKGEGRSKHLMMVGDAGQAIYNRGFRWADVGLRIGGGNVHTLVRSERSTQQILDFARSFFGVEALRALSVDGAIDMPVASKSGERPRIIDGLQSDEHSHEWLVSDIRLRSNSGIPAENMAVIAHSRNRLASVATALNRAGFKTVDQGNKAFYAKGTIKLITAHAAKGLEFSEVYLPDVNDGVYPFFKNRSLPDDERADRDAQDCQLLYVGATRAADRLTIMYDRNASPFLENARPLAQSELDVGF